MRKATAIYLGLVVLVFGLLPATAVAQLAAKSQVRSESAFGALPGRWVRPDGGYNGSTYTLAYDPAADVLKSVYFQAVAQQQYDVYFTRAK